MTKQLVTFCHLQFVLLLTSSIHSSLGRSKI